MIVRPDGTGSLELVPGDEPAWSPDGQVLYFRRGDRIWRVRVHEPGAAQVVAGTEGRARAGGLAGWPLFGLCPPGRQHP